MKILAPYKYQLNEFKKSGITYYLTLIAVTLLSMASVIFTDDGIISMTYDAVGVIFIFVYGLCSFKENFYLFSQNGVSRKRFFISRLAAMASIALIMTFADQALYSLIFLIHRSMPNYYAFSLFGASLEMYAENGTLNAAFYANRGFQAMLVTFFAYLASYGLGSFINLVFYRLNAFGKVIVGAGVPVLLLIVLPVIDTTLLSGLMGTYLLQFFSFAFASPGSMVITFIAAAAAFMALSWLLMRRAVIKKS